MTLQRRVLLAAALLKAGARGLPPGSGPRKERLFAKLEEGAWDLPESLFISALDDGDWLADAIDSPEAKALLEAALKE